MCIISEITSGAESCSLKIRILWRAISLAGEELFFNFSYRLQYGYGGFELLCWSCFMNREACIEIQDSGDTACLISSPVFVVVLSVLD